MPIEGHKSDIWNRIPVIRNNWSLKCSLRARDAIEAAVRVQPLDALFLHTQTIALFAIPLMRHIPTVISLDATPINYDTIGAGYNHKVGGNGLLERGKFLWNQNTFNAATGLVTFCQWAKDSLVADYSVPAEKVTVIPPGVDMEEWHFGRGKAAHQNTTSGKVRLLFVGGDFDRKGGRTLIEAFRSGLMQNCTLDIVTKDTSVQDELAGMDGVQVHCNLAANSTPLKELFAKADIFVFPTQADCLPHVVLEAMAAGLPIIATDVGALREQVEDGVNGLIVPPSDAGAVIAAVRALCGDETTRGRMAAASRRIAEERFDARRNYNAVLDLMKTMVSAQTKQDLL
ncbi:glycosyltransferase family 4 protein [Microcoleus sp. FACHB-SPT15]|uniref:glycosyltransferase family 4 protein n=1 Tax=Microcoleus sp. FACHB-SPT15 TaxID=2692830 RepID=UPI001F556645|nr:glycosyltransferase family 4 protein [Microcoleus sp. FACHB-SPT15]